MTPWVAVTPEYFRVLGLPLLEGRLLDERDARTENLEAVVVDRAWAKRFFPNESAVGKRLRSGGCTQCPWTAVVGVVSQVKYAGLDKPDRGHRLLAAGPELHSPDTSSRERRRIRRRCCRPSVRSSAISTRRCRSPTRQRWRDGGAIARTAAIAVDAGRRIRDRRAGAVDDRHLRCDGALRPAAHEGHQHPPGTRRQPARCASARRRSGHAGGRDGRGRRRCVRVRRRRG